MNKQIKELRKILNITQEEFSSKIGLSRNFIAQIETGTKSPSDRTVSDICRVFNVNRDWLQTGSGDIFKHPEDEVATIVSDLLEEDNPMYDLIKSIMKTYQKLDAKSKKTIEDFAEDLLKELGGD